MYSDALRRDLEAGEQDVAERRQRASAPRPCAGSHVVSGGCGASTSKRAAEYRGEQRHAGR
jgi:hypothetical protein